MNGVLKIACGKFVALGSDEGGAALPVTTVMLSLMILAFASVYAIGAATRDKIHLQNAADAAAYSAAVVQADALSRLATINKAMSWTYVQQSKREMDYIVYKWLEKTLDKYDRDHDEAKDWHVQTDCPIHRSQTPTPFSTSLPPFWWSIGYATLAPTIDLNGKPVVVPPKSLAFLLVPPCIRLGLPMFLAHLLGESSSADAPMAGIAGLGAQIVLDSTAITAMNIAESNISMKMKKWMRDAAKATLEANIPNDWRGDTCWSYHHDESFGFSYPDAYVSYLRIAKNNREDERQFCSASEENFSDSRYPDKMFEKGIDKWFVRATGHNSPASGSETGIRRAYNRRGKSALHSSWDWYSVKCIYIPPTPTSPEVHIPVPRWGDGEVYGDDPSHSHYETATARPYILKESYFGEEGTVSVGVARRAGNVWRKIIGNADGIFAAFTPSVGWSWAYSSAKAGYHRVTDSNSGSRAFDISWRGDGDDHGYESSGGSRRYWNLCVTDWDAMFLPVRKAKTQAKNGRWSNGNTGFLADWAAGRWESLGGGSGSMVNVAAPSGLNGTLDWRRLTDVMYH